MTTHTTRFALSLTAVATLFLGLFMPGPRVARAITPGRPLAACTAPVKPNGGERPTDLTISPHSGPPTQVITLHLTSALIASRSWKGFYILWDGTQQIEDGGGAPPQDLTFTPPDYNTTGTTTYQAPGYHTVGVYDTYVNVATIEPQTNVTSASFYVVDASACATPTVPAINALQLPTRVRGGHALHLALTTDPHARVRVAMHVPSAAGTAAYDVDVETAADSTTGDVSLDIVVPTRPRRTVTATVTIVAHNGAVSVRQVAQLAVTP